MPPDFPASSRVRRARRGLGTDLCGLANSIATSIDPQAVGWWILTGLAALVGVIVLAQALARQAAMEADEYPVLGSLGATRRQLFRLTMARTLRSPPRCGGGCCSLRCSPCSSPSARRGSPTPTRGSTSTVLLLGGAAVALAVVVVLGLWPAIRASRAVRSAEGPGLRPSRIVAAVSASGAPPSAVIGIRNALERGRGRSAVPVGSALVGAVLAVAVLCGAAVFGASLTRLTSTPALYGQDFDAWISANATGTQAATEQLLAAVQRPGITAILAGVSGAVSIDGTLVDALAGQTLRGPYVMTTTAGVVPAAPGNVLLGTKTM